MGAFSGFGTGPLNPCCPRRCAGARCPFGGRMIDAADDELGIITAGLFFPVTVPPLPSSKQTAGNCWGPPGRQYKGGHLGPAPQANCRLFANWD